MKDLFDKVSFAASKNTTTTYSTSFSMGIYCLSQKFHIPIYSIYGFVRFADEIVDTFHEYNKEELLQEFKEATFKAIERGISLNPILNSFQYVVNTYQMDHHLIESFFNSMEMDLKSLNYTEQTYNDYIFGSAEVVGLMCLSVFTENNNALYEKLKPAALKLGAAFQKINFLRDLKNDYAGLGRIYFPYIDLANFSESDKKKIETDINHDFEIAFEGIKALPVSSKFGVYVAYIYYKKLFEKIMSTTPANILEARIRIPNYQKLSLLLLCYLRRGFNLI